MIAKVIGFVLIVLIVLFGACSFIISSEIDKLNLEDKASDYDEF